MNRVTSDEDRRRINQAVQEAESRTSAEIVPVVAESSGRYDRPEDMAGLWIAALAMTIAWLLFPLPTSEPVDWAAAAPVWQLIAMLAAGISGFIVGVVVSARVPSLRRLFTPKGQMEEEVQRRAREIFFDRRVHHTQAGSGALLYVSLYEHMAVILVDKTALDHLGQARLDELCWEFTNRLQQGSVGTALCDAILSVGNSLAPLLPRAGNDTNELPDALVTLE